MPHIPEHLLTAKEKYRRRALAAELEDTLSLVRSLQRTNDYLTGYSLAEAINERVDIIGASHKKTDMIGGRPTQLAALARAKEQGLAAIDAAIKYEEEP